VVVVVILVVKHSPESESTKSRGSALLRQGRAAEPSSVPARLMCKPTNYNSSHNSSSASSSSSNNTIEGDSG